MDWHTMKRSTSEDSYGLAHHETIGFLSLPLPVSMSLSLIFLCGSYVALWLCGSVSLYLCGSVALRRVCRSLSLPLHPYAPTPLRPYTHPFLIPQVASVLATHTRNDDANVQLVHDNSWFHRRHQRNLTSLR